MTQAEKARAYDEAIEKLRKFYRDYDTVSCLIDVKEELVNLFPELRESEDERIRKALIDLVKSKEEDGYMVINNFSTGSILAWLEKQGEQKPTIRKRYENIAKSEWFKKAHEGMLVSDEEPKFHEGEWVVWKGNCYRVNYNGCGYELTDQKGLNTSLMYGTVDENAHLWTIQDAKDGDVLVVNGKPFICYHTDEYRSNYCCIDDKGCFRTNIRFSFEGNCILPATEEQRDLLFQKMKEAGYKWDAEKKELKEINSPVLSNSSNTGKDEPTWSDEDEELLQHCCGAVAAADYYTLENKEEMESWLKSIKDRVQPRPKQEWSESDKEEFQIAIDTLVEAGQHSSAHWLKSLKERMEEQQ